MPSFCSSPWIRGAPQSGLAAAISATSKRMAESVLGRPGRFGLERCVQRRRSHWRCHRSTVSGCTTIKAVRHSRHPLARRIQKSRSLLRSCGRLTVRVNAASCWRSATFSRATARCPRQSSPIDRRSTTRAVSIRDLVVRSTTKSSGRTAGRIMANHRWYARSRRHGQHCRRAVRGLAQSFA
jgi:hypothetical protein